MRQPVLSVQSLINRMTKTVASLATAQMAAVLAISALATSARAAEMCEDAFRTRSLFGLEFTFTNQAIVDEGNANPKEYGLKGNPLKEKAWNALVEKVRAKCTGDCQLIMSRDKHGAAMKVQFTDGFYFTIGIDSAVLEANAKPLDREDYRRVAADRMEKYLFASAREVGLVPHERAGGGHIHISRKAFLENAEVFRNFAVDFQNRPELVYGALGNHLGNSAPLAALGAGQRDAFQTLLNDFDRSPMKIDAFVNALHRQVFTQGFFKEWGSPNYYQAFNMTRMENGENATLEIRSFRPQENTRQFELQTQLLERWVWKMSTLKKRIPYERKDRYQYTPQDTVDAFAQLLRDLDLPYEEFKELLPHGMRRMKPSAALNGVKYSLHEFQ